MRLIPDNRGTILPHFHLHTLHATPLIITLLPSMAPAITTRHRRVYLVPGCLHRPQFTPQCLLRLKNVPGVEDEANLGEDECRSSLTARK